MYKVLWQNTGVSPTPTTLKDKISFYFTWTNLMMKSPANQITVTGPSIAGYQMVRLDKMYIKIMTNNQPVAIVMMPGDVTGGSILSTITSTTILSIPGARVILPNISTWDTTGTGPYGWMSEPGSRKGRTFKMSFYSPLHTWLKLTSTSQAELDWKNLPWFQGFCHVFDPSQPDFTPQSFPEGKFNVTWKANLYVTYGQYEATLGTAPGMSYYAGAEPPQPIDDRDDHLINTAVALHKCGATDCIDLTDLDDIKGPKASENRRPGGSSDPFLTPLLPPPVTDLQHVVTVTDDVADQMSELDSCSETEDETDFE